MNKTYAVQVSNCGTVHECEELQDSIPLALRQDMRRLKAYFPYRIVYGAISPTGETVAAAVATMHKPNALARKGWAVWRI